MFSSKDIGIHSNSGSLCIQNSLYFCINNSNSFNLDKVTIPEFEFKSTKTSFGEYSCNITTLINNLIAFSKSNSFLISYKE